jgi:hypothetical protein
MALRLILGTPGATSLQAMYVEANMQPLRERIKDLAAMTYARLSMDGVSAVLEPRLNLSNETHQRVYRTTTKGSQLSRVYKHLEDILITSGGLVSSVEECHDADNRVTIDTTMAFTPTTMLQTAHEDIRATYADYHKFHVHCHFDEREIDCRVALLETQANTEEGITSVCGLPSYTNLSSGKVMAIIAALNIAGIKKLKKVVIFSHAYREIYRLSKRIKSYEWFCIAQSLHPEIEEVHIVWLPEKTNDREMQVVRNTSTNHEHQMERSIVTFSNYASIKGRIKGRAKAEMNAYRESYIAQNEKYQHLVDSWPIHAARSRATETTITRIRLYRSRLNEDLFRWNLKDTPNCTYCMNVSENMFHYLFVCPARQQYRDELDQFFVRDDVICPLETIMTVGAQFEAGERMMLLRILEDYLLETGLARVNQI